MHQADKALQQLLDSRVADGSLRTLEQNGHLIDFASNDYLGLSRSAWLRQQVEQEIKTKYPYYNEAATGSRLISGNNLVVTELEDFIATYHHAEAALLCNSGLDANMALLSAVPQPGDLIVADELVHASLRDGIKLSRAAHRYFAHNDLDELEEMLQTPAQNKFVVVESLYSMDGDFAPLEELVTVCQKYHANLIVDEAHTGGVYGEGGRGKVCELGLEKQVYARLITYGKAFGSHGAALLGSELMKQFLVNYGRPFIYSTALPLHTLIRIRKAYDILSNGFNKENYVSELCDYLDNSLEDKPGVTLLPGKSQIRSLLVPGNEAAKGLSTTLKAAGIYTKAILYPTVPRGTERLRICLHKFNTKDEIALLCKTINNYFT